MKRTEDPLGRSEVTSQDLKEALDKGEDICLVDVRWDWEFKAAQIPGSLHVPLTQILERQDEIPKDKLVVLICHHGFRSMKACMLLLGQGYTQVTSLKGGIEDWSLTIDPTIPTY